MLVKRWAAPEYPALLALSGFNQKKVPILLVRKLSDPENLYLQLINHQLLISKNPKR